MRRVLALGLELAMGALALDSFGPEVANLLRKLLLGYRKYFDKRGVLNSDGRRLLEEALRYLIYEHPELKPLAKRVRKDPTLDNVARLARLVLGDEVEELVSIGIYGIYSYRFSQSRSP